MLIWSRSIAIKYKDQVGNKVMKKSYGIKVGFISALLVSGIAQATIGYSPHGIGMKSKGMGGVSIGYQADAVAVGANPAGGAFMGNRMDVGVSLFRPIRDAEIVGNMGPGVDGNYDGSDADLFPIPEFGYRARLSDKTAYAISVFGNGGMNTDYESGVPLFNATGARTGINLMQLFIVPSIAYKLTPDHAVGIALNLVAQGFEAKGLQNFLGSTENPAGLTNNGMDWAFGAGIRVGWTGKVSDKATLAATYQMRTRMSEWDDYSGLFAEQGSFDIPSNYGVGLVLEPSDGLIFALDIMRINFSEVDSVGNPLANLFAGNPLGSDAGPGFGWKDSNIVKIGVEFPYSNKLTLRAGYLHGRQPVEPSETLFNVLAPAVVEDHITFGGTWSLDKDREVTLMYMHAFENDVQGSGSIPGPFGGGEVNIKMVQDALGIAMSWKYY